MTRDYLIALLDAYWFAPPVALWRAVELRTAAEQRYERPLLDLGCGDGLIGKVLFGAERQVDVGLDPWIDQLRRAVQSNVYRHVDQADGHHLPYSSDTFATVFSNSVLEHIPDVKPVLREVKRVLRPGGRFIFTVPSDAFRRMLNGYQRQMAAGRSKAAEAYAAAVDERFEHYHYHTPDEWRVLLSSAGMTLNEATYYMPEQVERYWDRKNVWFGLGQKLSIWGFLASPRLRFLGHGELMRRFVRQYLGRRWRPYYERDVEPGEKGGGLLIVARSQSASSSTRDDHGG